MVVPKESRVPTAKTTLVEAPETAAEAEAAAEQTEFPIYNRKATMILLMTTARITMNLTLPVTALILQTAAILLAVIRSLILLRTPVMGSGDTSGGDTSGGDASGGDTSGGDAPAIPDYTETPGDGYEPSEDNKLGLCSPWCRLRSRWF